MSCPIIFNSKPIELTVHTYFYCGPRLTCVTVNKATSHSVTQNSDLKWSFNLKYVLWLHPQLIGVRFT